MAGRVFPPPPVHQKYIGAGIHQNKPAAAAYTERLQSCPRYPLELSGGFWCLLSRLAEGLERHQHEEQHDDCQEREHTGKLSSFAVDGQLV